MRVRRGNPIGRAPRAACPVRGARAFSLIELLVVVAILALLVGLLLPAFGRARQQARIVRVHADLRQIGQAVESYALTHRDHLPPTRVACGTDTLWQLPVELAEERYFPRARNGVPQADFADLFAPAQTYKYRAPGPVWQNGHFYDAPDVEWKPRALLWVPDDAPRCAAETGRFYAALRGEPRSPVGYALWSVGPEPQAAKFPRIPGFDLIDESRFPLPRAFWLQRAGDVGLITHFRTATGATYTSP